MSDDLALARGVGERLLAHGLTLVTAESCTGGEIAWRITAVAGSSAWFDRGFVTYSNAAKTELLGVSPALLAAHGAVSEAVVRAMAAGAVAAGGGDGARAVAVAVSGIAGPGGATPGKPVGTVCLAWQGPRGVRSCLRRFPGGREAVRREAARVALTGLLDLPLVPRPRHPGG